MFRPMIIAGLLLSAGLAAAQDAPGACVAPTIEISTDVRAARLRIVQSGEAEARVWADPGGEGEWKLDRKGLPDPIPAGKTFENVELNLRAQAAVRDDGSLAVRGSASTEGSAPSLRQMACN